MEAITISLSRNHSERDWSVVIDGHVYEQISTKTLDDLVDYVLIAAEHSLLESEAITRVSEMDFGCLHILRLTGGGPNSLPQTTDSWSNYHKLVIPLPRYCKCLDDEEVGC
jgi:hypothetical protein